MTLVEVSSAATITIMVLTAALSICIYGLSGFFKGQARVDAESASEVSIRKIAIELRDAMSVTIDSNGNGITYTKNTLDGSGNIVVPPTSDGVTRRIALSGSNIVLTSGSTTRTLARNVIQTDPANANAAYRIFSTTDVGIVRSVRILVVIQSQDMPYEAYKSRARETIYFRNIPVSIH